MEQFNNRTSVSLTVTVALCYNLPSDTFWNRAFVADRALPRFTLGQAAESSVTLQRLKHTLAISQDLVDCALSALA